MALATSSFVFGALVMFIFGLSTIPALFSLGFFFSSGLGFVSSYMTKLSGKNKNTSARY